MNAPAFAAPFAPPDEAMAASFLELRLDPDDLARAQALARDLIAKTRREVGSPGVEQFLQEFSLSTREGLAVMALAESLLRVPDDATLDALLADRLLAGDFAHHHPLSEDRLLQAAAFALGLSARLIDAEDSANAIVAGLSRRLGAPALRIAARRAMRFMGAHFVYGETLGDALARARAQGGLHSFDMLGEAARTRDDADRYSSAYAEAIEAAADGAQGVSIKLSALHPRYEPLQRERALKELGERLQELARLAKTHRAVLTIDAEEADRLELSLELFAATIADPALQGFDGLGLAVQAYQKRAPAAIDYLSALAGSLGRRIPVRLVKGAYWDSEIKRAQLRGLDDYPVFTRKAMTDASYLVCARRLLAAERLAPAFATHNALTVASILTLAQGRRDFEFQRLHGMGEALAKAAQEQAPIPWRIYAPVGPHRDLLAYLARRLIENGANSSFVARAADPTVSADELVADPFAAIASAPRHPRLRAPRDVYEPLRRNARGIDFGDAAALATLRAEIDASRVRRIEARASQQSTAAPRPCRSPIDGAEIGAVVDADAGAIDAAMAAAQQAFGAWSATDAESRAQKVERAADLIEMRRGAFIALLQDEAGKTLADALAEAREAADLCRYYARQARIICATERLPGPVGEENSLERVGRGVFVCIAPWNFPLAIFVGQIAAALVAGNSVAAKPAEQTPLTGFLAVEALHDAGVPRAALQLLPGDGEVGAALVAHPVCSGVVFTGSFPVAQAISRALARRSGPIAPLIAETGGVNAMIVDSTALLEQVADDVLSSAFRSAGQRCSALRLLCLQEEIADSCLATIIGAAKELFVGDPREFATDLGPVIDAEAHGRLWAYLERRVGEGRALYLGEAPRNGFYIPPAIIRLDRVADLREEVFGPILHVATWRADGFGALLDAIRGLGYGLTLGLATRIERRQREVAAAALAGNVYVNRDIIGAAVGGQPFGGFARSGTGPKAGGPDYLRRFTREITVTINTAAAGGDAGLMAMEG